MKIQQVNRIFIATKSLVTKFNGPTKSFSENSHNKHSKIILFNQKDDQQETNSIHQLSFKLVSMGLIGKKISSKIGTIYLKN